MFQVVQTENHITIRGKDMISNLLSTEPIPLGGLNSGVPTRTTSTLTPTLLRNIDPSTLETQCHVESHQNQAGFVPPVVQTNNSTGSFMRVVDTKNWHGGSATIGEGNRGSCPSLDKVTPSPAPRRSTGGRKPNKDLDVSPEELERRAVRRERNKMAAARCRKRRLDHTNELIEETEDLEEKKQGLQNEIQELKVLKEQLEELLERHKPCFHKPPCSPPDVKPFHLVDSVEIFEHENKKLCKKQIYNVTKRPDSLPVVSAPVDIPITTPTAGIPFNFDSLMEGGTGLTPVSAPLVPSCSTQQRNSDLLSPDSNKLVSL